MINKYMPVQAHFMIKKYWMRVSGVAQGSEHRPTHTEAYQKIFLSFFAPTHMWFTLFVFNQRKNSFRGSIHLCSTVWDFYMTSACTNLLLKLVHKLQSENIKWCVLFTHRNKNREDLLETKINAREVSLCLQSNRIPWAAPTPGSEKGLFPTTITCQTFAKHRKMIESWRFKYRRRRSASCPCTTRAYTSRS